MTYIEFEARRKDRVVTPERARKAAQRLIDSSFNTTNKEHARFTIPCDIDDDDIVIHDFIKQHTHEAAGS